MCRLNLPNFEKEEYISIFANYSIDELEFSLRNNKDLERIIVSVKEQGQFIKKSQENQTVEYAFPQGRVVVQEIQPNSLGEKLRIDIICADIYQSKLLLKSVGLL